MAKKVFTDESLAIFVDEIKAYTDDAVSTKANSNHTHAISNITNLQSTLDGKVPTSRAVNGKVLSADIILSASDVGAAASGHTHDDRYYTESEIDAKFDAIIGEGASTSLDTIGEISAAIEGNQDMLDTLNSAIGNKANASDLSSHTGNNTVHITSTERTNWNAAKTHADSAHAPSNAEKNQNAFSNIAVGSTTIAADSATDTLTLVGSNVTITPDATKDQVTIAVADGTTSAKGIVQLTNSTSSTSTTTAATPSSVKSAYDLANTAKTNAATAQSTADSKVGSVTLASGTNNGTLKLTVDGTATDNIAVKGLGSAAYTASSAYAAASHGTHVSYGTSATAVGASASAGTASTVSRSDHTHSLSKSAVTTALGYTPPTTNTTYGVATSDTLGLVKSGTDITVDTSGNVSVNNNSHTHTVSNISDLTATAAELNKLDGVTATTAEINYLDGVTSNIQAQLDAKAASSHTHTVANISDLSLSKLGITSTADHLNSIVSINDDYGLREISVNAGGNGVWTCEQYADGRVILYGNIPVSNVAVTSAFGSLYRSNNAFDTSAYAFPCTFAEEYPICTIDYQHTNGVGAWAFIGGACESSTPPVVYLIRPSTGTTSGVVSIVVRGHAKMNL